jgi:hypothetical protein
MTFELPQSFWTAVDRVSGGDPQVFLRRVVHEGLLSLLLADPSAPQSAVRAARAYEALDRTNRLRTRAFEQSVREMLDVIGDAPIIILKGTDYAYRLYPAPHLRPRQDIDVLVRREDAKRLARRLKDAGYEQHFPAGPVARLSTYHEAVFVVGNATIELHHSFVQRARNRVDYEGVWKRAKPWSGFDQRLLRLDDVDGLVYHTINMNSDQFSTPIFRHLDLWLMLRGRDEILPEAVARAREWSTKRALYGGLRQTSRYFPEFGTPAVQRAMEELLPPRTRTFLDRSILPDPFSGKRSNRWEQLWRKLWLMDSARFRTAFALYHAYAVIAGGVLSLGAARQKQHGDQKTGQHNLEAEVEKKTRGDDEAEGRRRIQ